jgi:hypothetical protein
VKPSEKHPEIKKFLDTTFHRTEHIEADTCVFCGNPATEFDDELSKKEFTISGLCQSCQNKVFGGEHD